MPTPYRTDHVGSMVRPERLLDARDAFTAGKLSREALTQVEDDCILEALALQKAPASASSPTARCAATPTPPTSTTPSRASSMSGPIVEQTRPDGTKVLVEMHNKAVNGKLRQLRRLAQHEASFLGKHAGGMYKVTMPTPVRAPGQAQQQVPAPYTTWDEVQQDLVDIFRDEMVALAREGVPFLQMDKVPLAYLNAEKRAGLQQRGIDPVASLAAEIAYENQCFDAVRREFPNVILAMHLCRGNRTGWVGGSGGYDLAAEQLFNDLHVDRFLLEYDTERAGGFEPLRFVPKGRIVMLGLLSTKTDRLESKENLLRRIDEASKFIDVDQLALGPQCGFQSAANRDGASMTIDDQKRKLELIVETAREVWR